MTRAILACVLLTACSGVRLAGGPTRACAGGVPVVVSTAPKWAAQGVMLYATPDIANDVSYAANEWNRVDAGQPLLGVVVRAAPAEVIAHDGVDVVAREHFDTDDFSAVTKPWVEHETIVEADVAVDGRDLVAVFNLRGVLLHELGHALGLEHSGDVDAVMYCDGPKRGNHTITADDKAALTKLYGGP